LGIALISGAMRAYLTHGLCQRTKSEPMLSMIIHANISTISPC
jgi:hypothetical protein